ncbi:MAG: hypothetical protein KAT68_01615 [Bacteroidales bacterium]|nr:hypothetical protein [Bacteroidales bacterium]
MKTLFLITISVFFYINIYSQSEIKEKENINQVNAEQFLNRLDDINLNSFNYKGEDKTKLRHYGIDTRTLFKAYGNDGIGSIGSENEFSSDDMIGICYILISALKERTIELQNNEKEFRESIEMLRNEMGNNMKLNNEIENLRMKITELETKLLDLEVIINSPKTE